MPRSIAAWILTISTLTATGCAEEPRPKTVPVTPDRQADDAGAATAPPRNIATH